MTFTFAKQHWDRAAAAIVLVVFAVQFFHFVDRDETIPQSDTISHSAFAARLYHILSGDKPASAYQRCAHPPLTQLVSCAFFRVLGLSPKSARYSLIVFCVVFLLSVYGLGRRLGGPGGGLAALLVAASHADLTHYGRQYYIDLPGAATALLALLALLRSGTLLRSGSALLLGLALGLALLTKWTNLVFVAPPLLLLLALGCGRSPRAWGVLGITLGVSAALLYGYYRLGVDLQIPPGGRWWPYLVYELVCAAGAAGALLLQRRLAAAGEPHRELRSACNGAAAIFVAQVVAWPAYLLQAGATVMHFVRQQGLTLRESFAELLATNVYNLAFSFSGSLLLVPAGAALFFVPRWRPQRSLDVGLLGVALVAGLLATSHACPSFFRYLLVIAGLLAVVGGYWLGRLGTPGKVLLALLVVYWALPAGAQLWGSTLPVYDELHSVRSAAQLWQDLDPRPRRATAPDRRPYHLEELMQAVQADFRRRFRSRPEVSLALRSVFSGSFQRDTLRRVPMVRQDLLFFCLEYYLDRDLMGRLDGHDLHAAATESRLIEVLRQSPGPVYLVVLYLHEAEVADMQIRIHLELARRSRLVKQFQLPHGRRTGVFLIHAAR